MLLLVKLQDSSEHYSTKTLEAVADDLSSIPTTVDEVTFGGDIAAITSAMKEAVSQVEEHIHDVDVLPQAGSRHLAHRVNDVSSSRTCLSYCLQLVTHKKNFSRP